MISGSLNLDLVPDRIPNGSWNLAYNIVHKHNSIEAEDGHLKLPNVTIEGDVIGQCKVGEIQYIFTTRLETPQLSSFSRIYTINSKGEIALVFDKDLKFTLEDTIIGVGYKNIHGETVLYFTNSVDKAYLVNLDKLVHPNELLDFSGKTFKHLPEFANPMLVPYKVSNGAALEEGSYYFAVRFVKYGGTYTTFSDLVGPIDLTSTLKGTNNIALAGINLILYCDTCYYKFQVGIIYRTGDTETGYLSPLLDPTTNLTIDLDTYTTVDVNNIVQKRFKYFPGTIASYKDRIYAAKLKTSSFNYQPYACNVQLRVDSVSKNMLTLDYPTFRADETYPLYVSFTFNDGSESEAFIIPGNESSSGFYVEPELGLKYSELSYPTVADLATAPEWPFPEKVKGVLGSLPSGHLFHSRHANLDLYPVSSVRFNSNESYPVTKNHSFNGALVNPNGVNLEGQKVRHLRMPTNYGTTIQHFIRVNNLEIPAEIKDNIQAINFYTVERQPTNCSVLSNNVAFIFNKKNLNGISRNGLATIPKDFMYNDKTVQGKVDYVQFNYKTDSGEVQIPMDVIRAIEMQEYTPSRSNDYLLPSWNFNPLHLWMKFFPTEETNIHNFTTEQITLLQKWMNVTMFRYSPDLYFPYHSQKLVKLKTKVYNSNNLLPIDENGRYFHNPIDIKQGDSWFSTQTNDGFTVVVGDTVNSGTYHASTENLYSNFPFSALKKGDLVWQRPYRDNFTFSDPPQTYDINYYHIEMINQSRIPNYFYINQALIPKNNFQSTAIFNENSISEFTSRIVKSAVASPELSLIGWCEWLSSYHDIDLSYGKIIDLIALKNSILINTLTTKLLALTRDTLTTVDGTVNLALTNIFDRLPEELKTSPTYQFGGINSRHFYVLADCVIFVEPAIGQVLLVSETEIMDISFNVFKNWLSAKFTDYIPEHESMLPTISTKKQKGITFGIYNNELLYVTVKDQTRLSTFTEGGSYDVVVKSITFSIDLLSKQLKSLHTNHPDLYLQFKDELVALKRTLSWTDNLYQIDLYQMRRTLPGNSLKVWQSLNPLATILPPEESFISKIGIIYNEGPDQLKRFKGLEWVTNQQSQNMTQTVDSIIVNNDQQCSGEIVIKYDVNWLRNQTNVLRTRTGHWLLKSLNDKMQAFRHWTPEQWKDNPMFIDDELNYNLFPRIPNRINNVPYSARIFDVPFAGNYLRVIFVMLNKKVKIILNNIKL